MPHVAAAPERLVGTVVGDGHCVAFVRQVAGLPHTSHWRRGVLASGAKLDAGTVIATFDPDGRYGNHTDGRSHCAVFIAEGPGGLICLDQWVGQPVHRRTIHARLGGSPSNNADHYHAVELEDG